MGNAGNENAARPGAAVSGETTSEMHDTETDDNDTLDELGRLSPIEYDRRRIEAADTLGIRVGTLDAQVASRRPESSVEGAGGTAMLFEEVEPWPHPVDGEELLNGLTAGYKRFLALPDWAAEAMALWTVHAHAHDVSQISPILAFVSPEKRCGKTTALGLLYLTSPRPLPASNITSAALFRSVEKWRPTLLIDEADTFLKYSDELRGIFNSGHNRNQAGVIRTAGEDYEPRVYSTWSPKVIAIIGSLPGTLEDRAIAIQMRRRRSDEKVEKFRADRNHGLGNLASQCARWVQDNSDDLRETDPGMPRALNDRASDNWRALLAIADVAGGNWPEIARKAAESLTPTKDESSIGTLLLADIREILVERGDPDRISSSDLCAALVDLPDRPWSEFQKNDRALTTNKLSRRLKPFGIRPAQLRIGSVNVKGYARKDFTEVFERYLPPVPPHSSDQTETSKQVSESNRLGSDQSETGNAGSFGLEPRNGPELQGCFDVSDGTRVPRAEEFEEGVI
jgi:putative DNA primase/helicase